MSGRKYVELRTCQEAMRPWRTGRKVGRTIYMQVGAEPSDADVLIGVMDSPEIATAAVQTHNVVLADLPVRGHGMTDTD